MSFTYVKYLYAHFNVLRLLESQIIVGATKGMLIITKWRRNYRVEPQVGVDYSGLKSSKEYLFSPFSPLTHNSFLL